MKSPSMITFVLAVSISLAAFFFAVGDTCNNVASMTWDDACLKACNTPARYNLCQETLKNGPDTAAEVTVFALIAARQAKLKYEATMAEIDRTLGTGGQPLHADERAAVDHCKDKYSEARSLMANVADQMFACEFSRPRQEYVDAQVAVGSCQDGLWSYQSLPLYAMVEADLELTIVAYELGALIVGR